MAAGGEAWRWEPKCVLRLQQVYTLLESGETGASTVLTGAGAGVGSGAELCVGTAVHDLQ